VTPQNTKHQERLVQIYTKGCTKHQGGKKKTGNGYFRTGNSKKITFLEISERETAILERMKEIKVAKMETWGEQKKMATAWCKSNYQVKSEYDYC